MEFPIIILTVFLLIALTRVVTVIIHELGHAAAGLLLFKGQISIYIGSYGNPKNGIHFKVGRLAIHFKYNPLFWGHGLCTSDTKEISYTQGYLFTLAGPLASLIMGILSLCVLINPESHGALKVVSLFLLFSSLFDFLLNIRPNDNPIFLHDGTLTYNDGQTLKLLGKYRNVYKEITLLRQYYENGEIEKGILFFEESYSRKPDPNLLRAGIEMNIKAQNFAKALDMFQQLQNEDELSHIDYCNLGLAHSYDQQHIKALAYYNKSLEMNPESFYSLNNRGYTLNLLEKYQEAMRDFNKAIELNPRFAYAYNNRGLSKIKLGDTEGGLYDIEKSMQLDSTNSYAFKNLGIYHKDKGDLDEAMKLFIQAGDYDANTDGLHDLILETEKEIKDNYKNTETT